jgi:transposase-like protein
MDQQAKPNRTCPACGSDQYLFRSRKKLPPRPGEEGGQMVETKYRCKACGKEWSVRVSGNREARLGRELIRSLQRPLLGPGGQREHPL